MNKKMFSQIRIGIALFALLGVSACGGGGSATARTLPPAPSSSDATATLVGVDTNNNGVRDEVEINISSNTPNDADFATTMRVATAYQKMLTDPLPLTRDEALKQQARIICAASNNTGTVYNTSTGDYLLLATFDTPARQAQYSQIINVLGGAFDTSEAIALSPCQ